MFGEVLASKDLRIRLGEYCGHGKKASVVREQDVVSVGQNQAPSCTCTAPCGRADVYSIQMCRLVTLTLEVSGCVFSKLCPRELAVGALAQLVVHVFSWRCVCGLPSELLCVSFLLL